MIYEAWKKIGGTVPFGQLELFHHHAEVKRIDESIRSRIKGEAESALKTPWPRLTASLYREFRLNGNRANFENLGFERIRILSALFWGEYTEMEGRYSAPLVDVIWSICEQTSWVLPAHNQVKDIQAPDLPDPDEPTLALFSAQTAANLSLILHYLRQSFEEFSPLFLRRVERELKSRVIQPYLERDDLWWMGLTEITGKVNNWNPWINSNVLLVTLLTERNPAIRERVIEKVCLTLDRFLAVYEPDGGCDEGCTYWNKAGGSLFDCLEILHAACGIDLFSEPLIREIGRFLYRMQINGPWFVNFSDGAARIRINASLVYLYGKRINDEALQELGLEAFEALKNEYFFHGNIYDRLRTFSVHREMHRRGREVRRRDSGDAVQSRGLYPRVSWLPRTQVGAVREEAGTTEGFFLSFKGGHNNESHNHNDVGTFVVSFNGAPVLIDVGVETYEAKTFSARRYEIWTMQSSYHNLPEINGSMQRFGEEYRALEACFVPADGPEGADRFSLDLSRAYGEDASVNRWHREMTFNRKEKAVEWKESFAFRKRQSFQMHLMTPWEPLEADPGLDSGAGAELGGRLTLFNGPGGWSQASLAARPCGRGWSQASLGGRGQSDESLDNPFDNPFYGVDEPTKLTCAYPAELSVEIEEIILEDEKLLAVWPQRIYRVVFGGTAREGELHFTLRAGAE